MYASDAKICGNLNASRAEISGNLIVTGATIDRYLDASGATIGGYLNASRATIDGVNVTEPTEAEITRLREIIRIAEEQPETFEMSTWHCGTTHCAYGWNQVLDGMEVDNSTCQEYGRKTLPSIYHLVFSTNDIFLKNVKQLISTK